MAKKINVILMGLFVFLFSGVNLYFYLNRDNPSSISGFLIKNLPTGIDFSVIAFVGQWIILLLIVSFAYMRFLKHKREEEVKAQHFIIPALSSRSETNLDILYGFLKKEKSLSIGSIAKVFSLNKEKALEWAKILEDNDLATIEYPAFADPEIRIKEAEKENLPKKI